LLIITGRQLDVFEEAQARGFEDRMVSHLGEFFPEQCETLGEPAVRELIRYGIERAAAYEMVGERDVCKYVDLMMALGRDFDRDIQWAAAILTVHREKSPSYKVERLCEEAVASLGGAG
jgi:hypothetical protein